MLRIFEVCGEWLSEGFDVISRLATKKNVHEDSSVSGKLTNYKSLDVGKRYCVIKPFKNLAPGDILDLVEVVYSHYDDLHVVSFNSPGVDGFYLSLEAVPGEEDSVLDNASEYLQYLGKTTEFEISSRESRAPRKGQKYAVHIAENSDYQDGRSPSPRGDYSSYTEAVRAAKEFVDRSLTELHEKGMSAEDLYQSYTLYGDDSHVVPDDGDPSFSAWSYAKERSEVICKKR